MTKGNGIYRWWFAMSEDAENWQGPFDTRDDAVDTGNAQALADEMDTFAIGEADKTVATPCIRTDRIVEILIEELGECNEECWSEDGWEDAWTPTEQAELGKSIEAAVAAWIEKYPARTYLINVWRVCETINTTKEPT